MEEKNPIDIEVDGIRFLSVGRYYQGINNWVCHKVKEMDKEALDYAARNMSKMINDPNAVLVPVPGHTGIATNAKWLATAISHYTHLPILDALRGENRQSNYYAKYEGQPITEDQMGFHQVQDIPQGKIPYIIDNCVDTGTSAKAAYHALGNQGVVLTYAMSDRLLMLNYELRVGMQL